MCSASGDSFTAIAKAYLTAHGVPKDTHCQNAGGEAIVSRHVVIAHGRPANPSKPAGKWNGVKVSSNRSRQEGGLRLEPRRVA